MFSLSRADDTRSPRPIVLPDAVTDRKAETAATLAVRVAVEAQIVSSGGNENARRSFRRQQLKICSQIKGHKIPGFDEVSPGPSSFAGPQIGQQTHGD